ncbi:hypothetical protein E3N88_39318 [Mikania micrantha]|uniref:Uncharacterized protein n=1 Tax=Mikania micrantha TaxID=192012 RepID=A0A5N6LWT6_9ASTR|nr:hypothetical protein E3N88_39318 [Mikania micrantha]
MEINAELKRSCSVREWRPERQQERGKPEMRTLDARAKTKEANEDRSGGHMKLDRRRRETQQQSAFVYQTLAQAQLVGLKRGSFKSSGSTTRPPLFNLK